MPGWRCCGSSTGGGRPSSRCSTRPSFRDPRIGRPERRFVGDGPLGEMKAKWSEPPTFVSAYSTRAVLGRPAARARGITLTASSALTLSCPITTTNFSPAERCADPVSRRRQHRRSARRRRRSGAASGNVRPVGRRHRSAARSRRRRHPTTSVEVAPEYETNIRCARAASTRANEPPCHAPWARRSRALADGRRTRYWDKVDMRGIGVPRRMVLAKRTLLDEVAAHDELQPQTRLAGAGGAASRGVAQHDDKVAYGSCRAVFVGEQEPTGRSDRYHPPGSRDVIRLREAE